MNRGLFLEKEDNLEEDVPRAPGKLVSGHMFAGSISGDST
jgi:hypothetical protein